MNDNITIGMDLGDRHHVAVVLDRQGEENRSIPPAKRPGVVRSQNPATVMCAAY